MCTRTPLFLSEAKSILSVLLKRTFELFDLSLHFLEYHRLNKYLSKREDPIQSSPELSSIKPCKLNYNIHTDVNNYLQRLSRSCRLIKSLLRLLNAARLRSANDYVVIDDQIYDLIKLFQWKLNKYQRQIHQSHTTPSFRFYPETSAENQNYAPIDQVHLSFEKLSYLYELLLDRLYGVHIVRSSDILQPIVINIIRLLLLTANKFND